jgi:putative DNA primase/helicase
MGKTAQDLLCSRRAGVEYQPDHGAEPACWLRFLKAALPDPKHRAYFRRLCGLMLLGTPVIQAFVIHHGAGSNGKSTALNTLRLVLGDYAFSPSAEEFSKKNPGIRRFRTQYWEGRRFMFVDEFSQSMDVDFIKMVTGGSEVTAEYKGGKQWNFMPQFNLHFATNNIPVLPNEFSMERRFLLLHWSKNLGTDFFSDLAARLGGGESIPEGFVAHEGTEILNWMVQGLEDFNARPGSQLDKLGVPDDLVTQAKDTLRNEDPVACFLEACVEVTNQIGYGKDSVAQAELYRAYRNYMSEYGDEKPMTPQKLNKLLKAEQYGLQHNGSTSSPAWQGIRLKKGWM